MYESNTQRAGCKYIYLIGAEIVAIIETFPKSLRKLILPETGWANKIGLLIYWLLLDNKLICFIR
jgi:hypothetical protein